jgi:hypothetical protein
MGSDPIFPATLPEMVRTNSLKSEIEGSLPIYE